MVKMLSFFNQIQTLNCASPNFFFTLRFEQIDHFQKIHSRTGNPFNSMLFFDDEDRNIQAVSECDKQKKPEKGSVTLEEIGKRNTSAGNTADGTQLDAEIAGPENIKKKNGAKGTGKKATIKDQVESTSESEGSLLDKLVVVKYNGALGKNMGFGGPKKYLASFEANGVLVTVHECSLLKSFSTSLRIANLYVAICPYIEGIVEDSISSSWKSQGLALLQVECYLMLHSMVVYLSRNLN
ncbi:uncharacterized protein LOC105785477 isoform X4 [Gossypium raimondii]|uniref:Uncharacterized protein n=1 Tax=Gossypium raimondii TaxID=29730 RepID=A0A0D2R6Z0_GOSRA|nr:uncharacterized protein LOC105785477 isoform X4 [Gossypium raimondii]KJB15085.1 hypothetical protein B456_002G159200 [Gossypium raimondii]